MDLPQKSPKLEKRKKKDKVEYEALPMYRNSIGRTGSIRVDCPTKIRLEWRKHDGLNKTTHTANKGSPVITDEGKIVIGGDSGLILKLDLKGEIDWYRISNRRRAKEYDLFFIFSRCSATWPAKNGIHGTPSIHNGFVYIGTYEGGLYCFDERSGILKWRTKLGSIKRSSIGSSPLVYKDKVYIVTESRDDKGVHLGMVSIVDCDTGVIEWETDIMKKHSHSSICISPESDSMVVGDNSGSVHCWGLSTPHKLKWNFVTGDCVKGPITINKDTVYFGSWDHHVYALNAHNGHVKWKFKAKSKVMSGVSIDLDYKCLYVGSHDKHLYCLHEKTGELIWKYEVGNAISSCPTVTNNIVLVGSGPVLHALDKFLGKPVWIYTDKYLGSITCTPTITHNIGDKHKNFIFFTSRGRANPNGKMRSGVPEFLAAGVWCLGPKK